MPIEKIDKITTDFRFVRHGKINFLEVRNKKEWIDVHLFCRVCKQNKSIDNYIVREDIKKDIIYLNPINDISGFVCRVCYKTKKLKE